MAARPRQYRRYAGLQFNFSPAPNVLYRTRRISFARRADFYGHYPLAAYAAHVAPIGTAFGTHRPGPTDVVHILARPGGLSASGQQTKDPTVGIGGVWSGDEPADDRLYERGRPARGPRARLAHHRPRQRHCPHGPACSHDRPAGIKSSGPVAFAPRSESRLSTRTDETKADCPSSRTDEAHCQHTFPWNHWLTLDRGPRIAGSLPRICGPSPRRLWCRKPQPGSIIVLEVCRTVSRLCGIALASVTRHISTPLIDSRRNSRIVCRQAK